MSDQYERKNYLARNRQRLMEMNNLFLFEEPLPLRAGLFPFSTQEHTFADNLSSELADKMVIKVVVREGTNDKTVER